MVLAVAAAGSALVVVTGMSAGAGNVVANSTFDAGLTGWTVNAGASLSAVPGRSGTAARIGHAKKRRWTIALNDAANSVPATVAGAEYRARAWVRATEPGQRISLRVMEYRGRSYQGQRLASLTVRDTAWHQLDVRYVARTTGAGLDLNVVAHRLRRGVGVDVDDISLFAPSATPAPTPSGDRGDDVSTGSRATGSAPSRPAIAGSITVSESASSSTTRATTSADAATAPTAPAPATSTSAAAAASHSVGSSSRSVPAGWRQVWADEFDGSGLDSSRWKVENLSTYGDGNNELACLMNRPENLQVAGGALHLIARREATPMRCGSSDTRFPGGRHYTSAHVTTKGKAEWTYGRFEVRATLPTQAGSTKGLWPAFWLRPTAGGTGELDVLEAIGGDGGGTEHTKVHQTIWYDYAGTYRHEPATVTVPNGPPSAGYHVYAAEWEPGAIRWYIDGQLTYSRTSATTPWLDSAFDKPFYLRLNLAVGGNWPGSPSPSTAFPASYDIDYVRVYQR